MPQNALNIVSCDKQKTALACFLNGNITLVVFLAWDPLDLRSRGFPGQENHECDISTQKTHSYGFLIVPNHCWMWSPIFQIQISPGFCPFKYYVHVSQLRLIMQLRRPLQIWKKPCWWDSTRSISETINHYHRSPCLTWAVNVSVLFPQTRQHHLAHSDHSNRPSVIFNLFILGAIRYVTSTSALDTFLEKTSLRPAATAKTRGFFKFRLQREVYRETVL
jgi:hypothetical protein